MARSDQRGDEASEEKGKKETEAAEDQSNSRGIYQRLSGVFAVSASASATMFFPQLPVNKRKHCLRRHGAKGYMYTCINGVIFLRANVFMFVYYRPQ